MSTEISVLMAVYNGSAYLAPAIESILQQTWQDFEFLIINDASTDDTAAILQHYAQADQRIRVIHQAENRGLTASLNHGLQRVQGKYIARQDADDYSLPARLAQQHAYFSDHPQVVLVGTDLDIINAAGQVIGQQRRADEPWLLKWRLLFYNVVGGHSGVMFRRESVLAAGGYDETHRYSQDYELWLRLANTGEITILPEVLLHLRHHDHNISSTKAAEQTHQSLLDSQAALTSLLGQKLPLETVGILRAFWVEPFPPLSTLPLIQTTLTQLYQVVIQEWQVDQDFPRRLREHIAHRFGAWLRSVSLRHNPQGKLRLAQTVSQWSKTALVSEVGQTLRSKI